MLVSILQLTFNAFLYCIVAPGPPTLFYEQAFDYGFVAFWNPPTETGVPALTQYIIELTPPPPRELMLITPANDTSLILFYHDLVPITTYNVTVYGVSSLFPTLIGEPFVTSFTTPPGRKYM